MIEEIRKNWWLLLVRGLLVLVLGIFAIYSPGAVLATFLLYIGIVALLGGVFTIIATLFSKDSDKMTGILEGLLYLVIGVLFLWSPLFVVASIIYFIAIWALVSGIMQIVSAIRLRKIISNEWIGIVSGIISILFALILFFNVVESANAVIMTFGVFAIISGLLQIMLSFKLKGLRSAF